MARAFTSAKTSTTRPSPLRRHVCSASTFDRRAILLSSAGVAVAPAIVAEPALAERTIKYLQPNMLSTFQKKDQRNEIYRRANAALDAVLTAADASQAVRLVFNDAATFDLATMTGGMNASIILSREEASRPENRDLDGYVKKLAEAKAKIDEGGEAIGQGPISWSDLMVLGARCAVRKLWLEVKIVRAADKSDGERISSAFGAQWDVSLGRIDSSEADPAGRLPGKDASVEEIRTFMLSLNAKPGDSGPFSPKPPFWERNAFVLYPATTDDPVATEAKFAAKNPIFAEFKSKYDQSRKTVTRTDYEVDFINQFTKLTVLGAKFDPMAYLYAVPTVSLT